MKKRAGIGRRRRAPLGGCVRETEEGGRSEESERGSQGLRGDARRAMASRWKQEVAWEAGGGRGSVGARRPRALPTGAGKTTGGTPGGLGRTGGLPAQELGRLLAPGGALGGLQVGGPGRLLLFYFSVLFIFI